MIGNCQDSYSDWLEDLLLDVMGFARDLDYKMKSFLVTYLGLRQGTGFNFKDLVFPWCKGGGTTEFLRNTALWPIFLLT